MSGLTIGLTGIGERAGTIVPRDEAERWKFTPTEACPPDVGMRRLLDEVRRQAKREVGEALVKAVDSHRHDLPGLFAALRDFSKALRND